jgi:hypothetical protein
MDFTIASNPSLKSRTPFKKIVVLTKLVAGGHAFGRPGFVATDLDQPGAEPRFSPKAEILLKAFNTAS